jgi:hypothetical protein
MDGFMAELPYQLRAMYMQWSIALRGALALGDTVLCVELEQSW